MPIITFFYYYYWPISNTRVLGAATKVLADGGGHKERTGGTSGRWRQRGRRQSWGGVGTQSVQGNPLVGLTRI